MANLANRGAKAPTSISDQQDSQKGLVNLRKHVRFSDFRGTGPNRGGGTGFNPPQGWPTPWRYPETKGVPGGPRSAQGVDVWVAILPVNGPILGVSGVSADQTPGCLVARMGHRLGDEVSTHEAWWAVRDSNPRPPARHAGALAN